MVERGEDAAMIDLAGPVAAVASLHRALSVERALLVGISGIDGSGKGFIATRVRDRLERLDLRVALLNVDGWLNLLSRARARLAPRPGRPASCRNNRGVSQRLLPGAAPAP
jgi:pantothenate kinase-related protein Tda10